MSEKYKLGVQKMHEIFGDSGQDMVTQLSAISPDFANYLVEFGFGDLYARPAFDNKMREALILSCLIGQKNSGRPLKIHLQAMLKTGWSRQEVFEILILLIGYVGFPTVVEAVLMCGDILGQEK